jgi:MerR family transcriptional regulator, copper efflux regulator
MDASPTPLRLRIGLFAQRTGLSRDTIRFYERRGLLRPNVESNGYRTFDERAVERAISIQVAQGLGFSLAEIARTIDQWDEQGLTRADRLRFIETKTQDLSTRIEQLTRMKAYLEKKGAWIRAGERGIPPQMVAALAGPRRRRAEPATRKRKVAGADGAGVFRTASLR